VGVPHVSQQARAAESASAATTASAAEASSAAESVSAAETAKAADTTSAAQAETIAAAAAGQAGDENFPVALRLLPSRYRRHLASVYGFARAVDDMGDEAPAGERPRLLDELDADLRRLYAQDPSTPGPRLSVICALRPVIVDCAIGQQPFSDLISANRQDQVVTRYATFDDLLAYCELSANPVGRIVLAVFGVATPEREILSDRVCTALQIIEHLQDVAEDLGNGRVYLPAEDMETFGCAEQDLAASEAGESLRDLVRFEAGRAADLLDSGAPLIGTLRGAARVAVAGYVAGGRAALAAIAAGEHDVLRSTPKPGKGRLAAEALRAYATGR
jgi:squalene synthase HpnC